MRAVLFSSFALVLCVAACDDGTPTGGTGGVQMEPVSTDMALISTDMSFKSACGQPGDEGNAQGVGKFCITDDDCAGKSASICSTINNTDMVPREQWTYFCVKPLCATTWSEEDIRDYCGEGAVCLKNELGTACAPAQCAPK
jgi:hypothetical protein